MVVAVGAGHWDFHRKTCVQEMTHDCRNVHTHPSALSIQPWLLVWGLDQSVGRRPEAPAEKPESEVPPRPVGSESAF